MENPQRTALILVVVIIVLVVTIYHAMLVTNFDPKRKIPCREAAGYVIAFGQLLLIALILIVIINYTM